MVYYINMKKISAGVIIADKYNILIGHATGKAEKHGYDIFKGGLNKHETPIEGVLRELKEEAGIKLKESDLIPLGVFTYTSKKSLCLFMYRSEDIKEEFPLSTLKCKSFMPNIYYKHINKLIITEMDKFMHCPFTKLDHYLYRSLFPVVNTILKKNKFE